MSQHGVWAVEVLAARYADVVTSLRPEEWTSPSRCAGWSVQDLVAHTGSNFHVVVEPNVAPINPPPIAEDLQDLLVKQRSSWTAEQVAEEFEHYREADGNGSRHKTPRRSARRSRTDDRATSTGLGLTRMDINPETAIGQQANDFLNDRTARAYPRLAAHLDRLGTAQLGSMSADGTGGQAGSSTSVGSMSARSLR
jgi:hypothetical protein